MILILRVGRWSLQLTNEPDDEPTIDHRDVEYVPTPMQVPTDRFVGFMPADSTDTLARRKP